MTPDWLLQVIWYSAGVGGTGALSYFLSQRNYYAAIWTGFATGFVVLLAIALHIRNSLLRRNQQTLTPTSSPVPEQPHSPISNPEPIKIKLPSMPGLIGISIQSNGNRLQIRSEILSKHRENFFIGKR